MNDDQLLKMGNALDRFTGKNNAATGGQRQGKATEDDFPGDFERLKLSVVRPVFESIGNMLKERGHEFSISEEPGAKISIHIVPAGVQRTIHPYDWYPTFSIFPAPFTKSVGLQGRNMRPNSEATSGSRGDYKPAMIGKEIVERELMKFIGEIANW